MTKRRSEQTHPDRLDETATRAHARAVSSKQAQALADIRGYALAGRIVVLEHARRRMRERGANFEDLRQALMTATLCRPADAGRWKVTGKDRDGDDLTVVVELDDEDIVVTVF